MLQTRIVPSKPALILEGEKKNLIITDIHIGFENSMASNEIFIGKNSTINETISEISEIIDAENPDSVILCSVLISPGSCIQTTLRCLT